MSRTDDPTPMATYAIARLMHAPARDHGHGGRSRVSIAVFAAAGEAAASLRHGNTLEDLTPLQRFALGTPKGAAWAAWVDKRR